MLISDFEYDLPEELIAQYPSKKREGSRLLAVDRSDGTLRDLDFAGFPGLLRSGDVLILNNTKVFPARLKGRTETGAKIELFLVEEIRELVWETLARPVKRLKPGKTVSCGSGLSAEVLEITDEGRVTVEFDCEGDFDEILDEVGITPLPPYIRRGEEHPVDDRERYQTVYAKERGAIAAPTAGLHFTAKVIESVKKKGVAVEEITLHVGYGTFEPVRVDDISRHVVLPERYEIGSATADRLNRAKNERRRFVAVGTTTVRALEACIAANGRFVSGKKTAKLTITPGYRFCAVDALLTNFHLPRSSLLVLVTTFGGHDLIMKAYRHAVRDKYRFYSYGDCMFIE